MKILIDADGVAADLVTYLIDHLKTKFESVPSYNDITSFNMFRPAESPFPVEQIREMSELMNKPGLAQDLPLIPGAKIGVQKLKDAGFTVRWVTASHVESPTWDYDRRLWLATHFGATKKDIIFADSKEDVIGDALIDDKDDNIVKWSAEPYNGLGVIYDQPWNQNLKSDKIIRFTWADIDSLIYRLRDLRFATHTHSKEKA